MSDIIVSFDLVDNVTVDISTSNDYREPVVGALTILPSAVLIPTAIWLFGSGLIGLVNFARRKKG